MKDASGSEIVLLSQQLAGVVERVGESLVQVARGRWIGTAVVWPSDPGLVVTTDALFSHRGEDTLVLTYGSVELETELLGRDPTTSLVLLRAEGLEAPAPEWSEGADLKVGHLALTLGRPGRSVRATLAMIEALGGRWRTPMGGAVDRYIEVDGRLPRGFSGGVLVDLTGAVLGVNTRGLMRGGATLPTQTVRRVVDAILSHGSVRRGYLGVTVQPARLASRSGLLITSVEPGGPADRSGLMLGDVLLTLDGLPLERVDALFEALADRPQTDAPMALLRAGKQMDLSVAIGLRGGDGP